MQKGGGFRDFVRGPIGRALLIVVGVLALSGAFVYLGPIIAIPVLLIFGMGLPIYAGIKTGRQLAILGIVVMLVASPLASVLYTSEVRTPSPWESSPNTLPYGNNGSVLTNAHVEPFTEDSGGTFTFNVTVNPQYIPAGNSSPLWLDVWASTCSYVPTTNDSLDCTSGYSFVTGNYTFPARISNSTTVRIPVFLPGKNIWWWQMGVAVRNVTDQNLSYIFLAPSTGYAGVEGPITGTYWDTYVAVTPQVFFLVFLYSGSVFFIALLIYILLKQRERRKKEERARMDVQAAAAGAATTQGLSGDGTSGSGTLEESGASMRSELTCPNCHAVVYPNEARCWKCGVDLATGTTPAPLSSTKS